MEQNDFITVTSFVRLTIALHPAICGTRVKKSNVQALTQPEDCLYECSTEYISVSEMKESS